MPALGAMGLLFGIWYIGLLGVSSSSGARGRVPMQAGMLSHRSLHARALRLRESVIARLLLDARSSRSARSARSSTSSSATASSADLIREHAAVHAADARALEQRADGGGQQPLRAAAERGDRGARRDRRAARHARTWRCSTSTAACWPRRSRARSASCAPTRCCARLAAHGQAGRRRARGDGARNAYITPHAPARAARCCSRSTARATRSRPASPRSATASACSSCSAC